MLAAAAPPRVAPPRVVTVDEGSAAHRAGIAPGDEIVDIDGRAPRDVLEYRLLVDAADPVVTIERGGLTFEVEVDKAEGEALGIEVHSAVFDRVRTCDNHCDFCFIYQLPPGLRKSLYLKDDDYRLSFLYGNFTTLTRFTEADLERVVDEGLSPLHVSIHTTDPALRSTMLRNKRGAVSLRWLSALLDAGVEVHGQVVVCPDVNDGDHLEATLAGVADEYPSLASVCVVPLGVSKYSPEPHLRPHTRDEARHVVDTVARWQDRFLAMLGRRLVYAADEYYLLAETEFPSAEHYGDFDMHEDGVGMVRTFELEFTGRSATSLGTQSGFFAAVDGAPAEGYRAPRTDGRVHLRPSRNAPIGVLTGSYGARTLAPLLAGHEHVRIVEVRNDFFGGNVGVAGLLVGEDLRRVLSAEPEGHRYLLPDVCLSQGRFLDGTTPDDLPRPVEIVATDGHALREAIR